MLVEPLFKGVRNRLGSLESKRSSVFRTEPGCITLDVVQRLEELQRLLAHLALVVGPEFVELATSVGHAAHLGHAQVEALLVPTEVVDDQAAPPARVGAEFEEVPRVLTTAGLSEVEDHRSDVVELRRAPAPHVSPVRLALAGLEHGDWRFVGMQHWGLQQLRCQRIHQRLQLHAALADPLREGGSCDGHASALEDGFLTVQRKVIEVLGHQHLREQPCRRDALVDDVRIHGRLHQRLAFGADPLASDMAFHREDARGVVQLLADVLADALHRATTFAGRAGRLVVHVVTRQVGRQRCPLGLALLAVGLLGLSVLDLARHRSQVHVERLVEQALLLGRVGLTLGGELQSLEDRVLVRELVDKRLLQQQCLVLARQLGAQCAHDFPQLVGIKTVDGVVSDHGF